jgi:hypothetical protein
VHSESRKGSNMHPITSKLENLHPQISADDDIEMYGATTAKPIAGTRIHGFGVVIVSRNGRKMRPIAGHSDSDDSSHMRGILAATLSAMEWVNLNAASAATKHLFVLDDYVCVHLRRQLPKWMRDPKRANFDLLTKINEQGIDRTGLTFNRGNKALMHHQAAADLARDAAQRRFERVASSTDLESEIDIVDDTDWLYQRAIARDI